MIQRIKVVNLSGGELPPEVEKLVEALRLTVEAAANNEVKEEGPVPPSLNDGDDCPFDETDPDCEHCREEQGGRTIGNIAPEPERFVPSALSGLSRSLYLSVEDQALAFANAYTILRDSNVEPRDAVNACGEFVSRIADHYLERQHGGNF